MPSRSQRTIVAWIASLALVPAPAAASGLQVQPVSVEISERSGVIWLTNTAAEPLQVQVRVQRWSQHGGKEELGPAGDFIVSPPITAIAPGGRQLVRLVPAGAESCEDSYRLSIREIPPAAPRGAGLRYVLHYSVPVFVRRPGCAAIAPALDWQLTGDDGTTNLVVTNKGQMHAQLAGLAFTDRHGVQRQLTPGLLGYVLPGATRSFATSLPSGAASASGTLEAMVNGSPVSHRLAATPASR